jgi:hypothetical protein
MNFWQNLHWELEVLPPNDDDLPPINAGIAWAWLALVFECEWAARIPPAGIFLDFAVGSPNYQLDTAGLQDMGTRFAAASRCLRDRVRHPLWPEHVHEVRAPYFAGLGVPHPLAGLSHRPRLPLRAALAGQAALADHIFTRCAGIPCEELASPSTDFPPPRPISLSLLRMPFHVRSSSLPPTPERPPPAVALGAHMFIQRGPAWQCTKCKAFIAGTTFPTEARRAFPCETSSSSRLGSLLLRRRARVASAPYPSAQPPPLYDG